MTAEALSPPNPMQSLRERLIQEGSIKPNSDTELGLPAAAENALKAMEALLAEVRKFSLNDSYFREIARIVNSHIFVQKINFGFVNFIKFLNIYRIFKNLLANKNKKAAGVVIARTGFFFAFKENMRNTP